MPGDGQFINFTADETRAYGTAASGSPQVWFDTFAMVSLSTTMTYDGDGNVIQTRLPDGTTIRKMYDRFGRLVQVVDAMGNITQMSYDSLNRLVQTTDALGNTTSYTYDAVGNRLTVTDPNNNTTTTVYDRLNRRTRITYPDGSTEQFAYDPVGNVTTYTNNRGQTLAYTYDAANRRVKKTYSTDGTSVIYGLDPVGNLINRIERNGDICTYSYDAINRLVSVERDQATGIGSHSWFQGSTYDADSNRIQFNNGTPASGAVYGTDVYGTGTYSAAHLQWEVPTAGYDSMNRLVAYKDESLNETTMSFDVEGRLTGVVFPNGSPAVTTTNTYDITGHMLSSNTVQGSNTVLSLAYTYDANSNRVSMTTETDAVDYTLDATNRLVQEHINRLVERSTVRFNQGAFDGVDATSGALELIALADPFSTEVIDADRWRLAYTNNVTNGGVNCGIEVRPFTGGLCMVFPRGYCNTLAEYGSGSTITPPTSSYGLVSSGVFVATEHRVPITGDCDIQVDFTDWQGHPTGNEAYANLVLMIANSSVEDVWDNGGNSFVQMSINTTPQYSSVISNNGTITNNVVATTDTSGKFRITRSGGTVTTYYYNSGWQTLGSVSGYPTTGTFYISLSLVIQAMGHGQFANFQSNLSAMTYGTTGTYTSAVFDAGQSVTWSEIAWDATVPSGATLQFQIATSTSPSGPFTFVGPDGTSATYFSTSGTAVHAGTTGRYAQYQATLGGNGSVTPNVSRVDLLFAGTNASTEIAYGYDAASNMTSKVTEVSGSTTVTETRTVNNLNQITANTVVGSSTTHWSFGFDLSGNMTSRENVTLSQTTDYQWDEDNRLTLVTLPSGVTVAYTWDDLGRMITRTVSTDTGPSYYVWDGMDMVQETDPSGNVTRYYIVNGVLRSFSRGGTTYQVHLDALGSVRKVTDSTGSVVATYDTDAYGNALASTSDSIPNGGLQYRWVGGAGVRWDALTGLYYMRQRWYEPGLARFLSRDPVQTGVFVSSSFFDPFRINAYQYALSMPTTMSDSSGLGLLQGVGQYCDLIHACIKKCLNFWVGTVSYKVAGTSMFVLNQILRRAAAEAAAAGTGSITDVFAALEGVAAEAGVTLTGGVLYALGWSMYAALTGCTGACTIDPHTYDDL